MIVEKDEAFLNFLVESGVYNLHETEIQPLNTWKNRENLQKTEKKKSKPVKKVAIDVDFSKLDSLEKLQNELQKNSPESKKILLGDGISKSPEIMCIGLAPKTSDNRNNKVFSDKAGGFLEKMLSAIDSSREKNCYLTNIIPWSLKFDRPPSSEEIDFCLPFLEKQIEIIKPKIVILLGGKVTKLLTKKHVKMEDLGKWASVKNIDAMPIYTPEFLLFDSSKEAKNNKMKTWESLKEIKKRFCT
ncbi:MAG: uracil-DNA glycosylase [Alphaproteobacteria bacterium]